MQLTPNNHKNLLIYKYFKIGIIDSLIAMFVIENKLDKDCKSNLM